MKEDPLVNELCKLLAPYLSNNQRSAKTNEPYTFHFETGSIMICGGASIAAEEFVAAVTSAIEASERRPASLNEKQDPESIHALLRQSLVPVYRLLSKAFGDPPFQERLSDLLASLKNRLQG